MNEHLTALDATFLELEELDQVAHMHIGGVMVFEAQPGGGAPPIERIRAALADRLPELPRYRQRLSSAHTGGVQWPSWVEADDFDVAHHVARAGLPAPGGIDELREWAGEYFSNRLDRSRPLWESVVLELADGRWAMVNKSHHCLVDGVGSVDIVQTLLDPSPEPREPGPSSSSAAAGASGPGSEPANGGGVLRAFSGPPLGLARGGVRLLRAGLHAAERALGMAAHPARARAAFSRSRAVAELLVRDELVAAPGTSLNRPIGAKRRIAVRSASLDQLKQIKNALGGTVNDVVLAATAGGLRALLEARGEPLPEMGLRAMVPVNIRTAGDRLGLGNRISSLFVHLPVGIEDPLERYRRQVDEAESLKSGSQAGASHDLISLTGHAPPVLHSFLARSLYATRLFNLTITNVPGPQLPLYSFGSRLEQVWPIVPLASEHAVGVAVFSYDGELFFCLNADRDSFEDLELFAGAIEASIDELSLLTLQVDGQR